MTRSFLRGVPHSKTILLGYSASVYLEAFELWKQMDFEAKGLPTQQRVTARVKVLEITAMAAHVFATIQYENVGGDSSAFLWH